MTVPSPMVSRSVHIGTFRERMSTPRPIFAPSALRYSTYKGEPTNSTRGFDWTSVLTIQKRTYARLQMRICRGFQRPINIHLAKIGKLDIATKPATPSRADRR